MPSPNHLPPAPTTRVGVYSLDRLQPDSASAARQIGQKREVAMNHHTPSPQLTTAQAPAGRVPQAPQALAAVVQQALAAVVLQALASTAQQARATWRALQALARAALAVAFAALLFTAAGAHAQTVTNSVTIAPPAGTTDTSTGNDTASDTDNILPTISLQKALGGAGRINSADQFIISATGDAAATAAAALPAATSSGTGTTVTAGTGVVNFNGAAGTTYNLNEAMTGTSVSSLAQYSRTVSCTNTFTGTGATNVSGINSLPISVTPAFGDIIACTVTNSPAAPTISLQKALGGTGRINNADQFTLTATGTGAPAAVTTTGSAAAITSLPLGGTSGFTATAGTAYTLNEAMASGSTSALTQYSQAVSCTNTGPTIVTGINSLPISVTPTFGDAIVCTVTNSPAAPTIRLQKALGGTGRINNADQFTLTATGTGAPAAVTTAGSAAAISSAPLGGTSGFTATAGTAYTLNEAMASGSTSALTQYSQAVSCTNTGPTGVATINSLPISVTPALGDAIFCTITNSPAAPTIRLQKALGGTGRINNADQFTLTATGTGAPAAVTTTGSAAAISSAPLGGTSGFTATAGTAYTLNEAMASGSTSALTQYSQAVSCTNTGPTSVAAINSLPISVTPALGDAIFCTITNSPAAPTISLQKALGGTGRINNADQFSLTATGTGAPAAVTTTGSAAAISSAPLGGTSGFTATAGTAYTLNEAMASGSTSTLAQYSQAVSCSNTGPTIVTGFTSLPINVTPALGDAIVCTVTNSPAAPTIRLQKALGGTGRINNADQFSLTATGTGAPAAVTTTGSAAAITSLPLGGTSGFTATAGTAYTLNEAMASGSTSTLTQYSQAVSCTNTGPTIVTGINSLPISVTPTFGDAIVCTVTNSPAAPTIRLQKALGGTGRINNADQFTLTATGTGAPAAVTTTGSAAAISSAPLGGTSGFTATAGTAYTLNEAMAAGSTSALTQYSQAVACTNTGPTGVATINSLPISVTPALGDAIFCTITNSPAAPTISLQKALGGTGRINNADQFSLTATGTGAPAAVTTTGSAAAISSAPLGGTSGFTATAGTAYTLNEAMAAGSTSTLAQYSQAVSCSNTGPTSVAGFTSLPINVTPALGDAIVCTVTNSPAAPTIRLQKALGGTGRINNADQFSLTATGTGAPAAVTTTGSAAAISSAPLGGTSGFTATAGTAYTLNEAMAAGSTSTLTQYSQAVSCSNTGPTSVAALTSLPISVTPTFGDAIVCTVTNSPAAPTIRLQKALGGTGRINNNDQFSLTATGTGAPAAVTTTGSAAAITSLPLGGTSGFTATAGTAYTLDESMASGSVSSLAQYSRTVSCTNTGPTSVSGINSLPINVTPALGDAIFCTVTNSPAAPTISLQKALGGSGRINNNDQFSLTATGTGAPAAVTTTGSAAAITSLPLGGTSGFTATAGSAYTLNEAMASGSVSSLAQYSRTVSCTNTGPTSVTGINSLPINVTPALGDAIVCTVTNSPAPTVTVTKVSNNSVGAFNFSGTNGWAAQTITTTTSGVGVAGATQPLTAANTVTDISEALPAGYTLSSISCTGLGSGGNAEYNLTNAAVNGVPAHTVRLNAAATASGSAIACTFTNNLSSVDLAITKTNTPGAGVSDQVNDTLTRNQTTVYQIVVTNNGPQTVTGAVVTDPPATGLSCTSVTCSGSACPASPTVAGLQSAAGLTLGNLGVGSANAVTLNLTCTVNIVN
jgi:uncharacterized repeat protein (TIGR01451 family)